MNSEKKQDMADYYQGLIITQINLNQTGHHDDFLPGLELKLCCCRNFWFRITHSCSCCQCSPKTCRIILKHKRHHCRGAPAQWKREVIITEKSVLIYGLIITNRWCSWRAKWGWTQAKFSISGTEVSQTNTSNVSDVF